MNTDKTTLEEEEEERRVFHVAVTRAKDEVYLLVPQFAHFRGQGRVLMKPSRFLTEINSEVMEPLELETSQPHLTSGKEIELLLEKPKDPKVIT